MALDLGSGLSLDYQTSPASSTLLQGGDVLNLNLHVDYNATWTNFTGNSTACQSLSDSAVFVNFTIMFPVFLHLVRPVDFSKNFKQENIWNCSSEFTPHLNVSSSLHHLNATNATSFELELFGSNTSWTASFPLKFTVQNSVPADFPFNITGNFSGLRGEREEVLLASYSTLKPRNLHLKVTRTSVPETPGLVLTEEEEITFQASFVLPVVATEISFLVDLPFFNSSEPVVITTGHVFIMPPELKSENLQPGLPARFEMSTRAIFDFGKVSFTGNMTGNTANHTVVVELKAKLNSANGPVTPQTVGNVSCTLLYTTPRGSQEVETEGLLLIAGQPQLEHSFFLTDSGRLLEGNEETHAQFQVENPVHATEAAYIVSVVFKCLSSHVNIEEYSVVICSNISASPDMDCDNATDLEVHKVANNSLELNSWRLNASSRIDLAITMEIQPSVPAGRNIDCQLSMVYTRKLWDPSSTNDIERVSIKPVEFSGPRFKSSDVPNPSDSQVVTIGESLKLEFELSLPVSTNRDFMLLVSGVDFEGVAGQVKSIGAEIEPSSMNGKALNVTSGNVPNAGTFSNNVLVGFFGTVSNLGDSPQQPAERQIAFEMAMQSLNEALNKNGRNIAVKVQLYIESTPQPPVSKSFKVVEPRLDVQVTPSQDSKVEKDSEITFRVRLEHVVPPSSSNAYSVLLEVAVPHTYLTLLGDSITPGSNVQVMQGNKAPSGSAEFYHADTKVLVYRADVFTSGSPVTFEYKARTTADLPGSIRVTSPVHLSYTSLPASLSRGGGRVYNTTQDLGAFLTFRPDAFVNLTASSAPGSFDAGDPVQFTFTITHLAQSPPSAYDVELEISLDSLDPNRTTATCDLGVSAVNKTTGTIRVTVAVLAPSKRAECVVNSFVGDRIAPNQLTKQVGHMRYYSQAAGGRPVDFAPYEQTVEARIQMAPVQIAINASQGALELTAGDAVNFTAGFAIPECVTPLSVLVTLPAVPKSVLDRRRRRGLDEDHVGFPDARSSRFRRSADHVYALTPLLGDISVTVGSGLVASAPNITRPNVTTLLIDLGLVQNLPGSGGPDTIEVLLKFQTSNSPLILSGRQLAAVISVNYDGGSQASPMAFMVVGPLLKPLLAILKSVKLVDAEPDSPQFQFNVTVRHAPGSQYDARDVVVRDRTEDMKIFRSTFVPSDGTSIAFPETNVYEIIYRVPKLRVGEVATLLYVASFDVEVKDTDIVRTKPSVEWKSVQLNSLTYRLTGNATACVDKNGINKAQPRQVFGYFALGALLGLLLGLAIGLICVWLIIKCCDKAKVAPYYVRFTKTTTMTALTGGSQYIYRGDDPAAAKPVEKHTESSIVQMDESIVPVLTLDSATQTEKQLDSLDVQATAALDADVEAQRQNLFVKALGFLASKLRATREISTEQEKKFLSKIKVELGAHATKMASEYKRRSAALRKKLQKEGKARLAELKREQAAERAQVEDKLRRSTSQGERQPVLDLLRERHEAEERDLKLKLKLDSDVHMERLRKEVSISKRFALKETQNKLLQELIKQAKLNEDQAAAVMREHLANMAAIDKNSDEERARRVMALEMRLAERRALARQKKEQEDLDKDQLRQLEQQHCRDIGNLFGSSKMSESEALAHQEKLLKEMEAVNKKLAKDRQRQESVLHQKLTARKQKKMEQKNREHEEELKRLEEKQSEKIEEGAFDSVAEINERQHVLRRQRKEMEEIETESDRQAAEELAQLREQQVREFQQQIKQHSLANKGLSEEDKAAMLERHMEAIAEHDEVREQQRRRQAELLEKRLEKHRKALAKKKEQQQIEQEEVRKQEHKIVSDLIVNQVAMSEEERDRIMEEHEKNLAEMESSLTLNKLRQRQKLEEKLAQRRKRKVEALEKQQREEEGRNQYDENILVEESDTETMKKREQQKLDALRGDDDDDVNFDEELDQVREEMLAERAKKLEEHHERLGAIIAQLQIDKAKQMSKIAMQQQALGQLQAGLVDDLETKGAFEDPETQKIMDSYHKETKQLEETLLNQRNRQEQALKDRLQEKMKQREATMLLQQENEIAQYMGGVNAKNPRMKLRKAALKARHQKELNDMRNRMQKEIDQSLNEMRLSFDIKRMKAIEEQNLKLISLLVKQGKLKEDELQSVLQFLFPTKTPSEIDGMLAKIYGPEHKRGSQHALGPRPTTSLEDRIRRASVTPSVLSARKPSKKKRKSKKTDDREDLLPPIDVRPKGKFGNDFERDDTEKFTARGERPFSGTNRQTRPNAEAEDDQLLINSMFGDSPEPEVRRLRKKRSRQRFKDE